MKQIQLTRGYTALVDDEDYERINAHRWCALVNLRRARAVRRKSGKFVYMHHEVLQLSPAEIWPQEVDHIDRNSLNNSKKNLRVVSHDKNMRNTSKVEQSTGVDFHKVTGKWRARKTRHKYLGLFNSREEALKAVRDSK
jgi:hypothetical protein